MSSPSPPQRRDAYRVGLPARARVRRASEDTIRFDLRDLSVGGAGLVGATRLEVDEAVTIEIGLGDEVVELSARVTRLDVHAAACALARWLPRWSTASATT